MILRFLAILLSFAVAGAFAQTGLFGSVTIRPKAGDLAPNLSFTKILSAPGATPWSPPDLSRATTVFMFFPDMSHNLEHVALWNELAAQFSGKPVQFVWVTGEQETTLAPWINEHPVKSWVLLDVDGLTGRSFGMEQPTTVIVGADQRIIGFGDWMVPTADTVTAALEGRISTSLPTRDITELLAFNKARKVLLSPEAKRMHRPDDNKPNFEPSYIVHIAPVKDEESLNASGPDYSDLRSFTLKALIRELYDVSPIRIQFPASLDDEKRYEVALVLPERETKEQMYARFRQGIQDYFHFTATREKRVMDVYVLTASDKRPPAVKAQPDDNSVVVFKGSTIEIAVRETPGAKGNDISAITGISMVGTMDDFCGVIEESLDRPVLDETNLQGEFEFRVPGIVADGTQTVVKDFLQRLHDQLGLSITPAQRTVEVLVIQPHN